jgi:hypothetical protein
VFGFLASSSRSDVECDHEDVRQRHVRQCEERVAEEECDALQDLGLAVEVSSHVVLDDEGDEC